MAERTNRNDYGRAWAGASLTGAVATVAFGTIAIAPDVDEILYALSFGLYLLIFIVPVWMIGVAVIGLPVLRLLEALRLDNLISALVLGAGTVGGSWSAVTFQGGAGGYPSEQWSTNWTIVLVGTLAGAMGGLGGWYWGHRKTKATAA